MAKEPLIHSHIEDGLSDDHPWADQTVYCNDCQIMVHAGNNECMTTWVETGKGAYCIDCFAEATDGVVDDDWGLET